VIGAGRQRVAKDDFGGLSGVFGVFLSPARKRAKSWKFWKSFFPAVRANLGNPKNLGNIFPDCVGNEIIRLISLVLLAKQIFNSLNSINSQFY
jgi:hypothetical protein